MPKLLSTSGSQEDLFKRELAKYDPVCLEVSKNIEMQQKLLEQIMVSSFVSYYPIFIVIYMPYMFNGCYKHFKFQLEAHLLCDLCDMQVQNNSFVTVFNVEDYKGGLLEEHNCFMFSIHQTKFSKC